MDRAEGRAYKDRWRIANARIAEEARQTAFEVRWAQMIALHDPRLVAMLIHTTPDVGEVRARWSRLRREYKP